MEVLSLLTDIAQQLTRLKRSKAANIIPNSVQNMLMVNNYDIILRVW